MNLLIMMMAGPLMQAQPQPQPQPQPIAVMAEKVRARVEAAVARTSNFKGRDEDHYRHASRLVDDRKYEEALVQYQQIVESKGSRIEGALYWKAYVLAKLGRREDAFASLDELKKSYAQSRWLNDAKALELEIKQGAGRGASPESQDDEDLKLLAINGLLASDPERAVPLLEKQLTNPKNSPKLKERSLFVLAQSKNARAREVVTNYAKGASNPDLQLMAVQYLGTFGGKENRDKLVEIYRAGSDVSLKRAVLRGLMMARDQEGLLQIARSEQNSEVQRDAIRYAGMAGADVGSLWNNAASKETKDAILEGLMMKGSVDKLAEIAKSDTDVKVRAQAVQYLANCGRERSGAMLVAMYPSEQDKQVRTAILGGIFQQGNAKALIEVSKKETDAGLKREAVRWLTMMKSPEATEYLMELLNK